MIDVTPSMLEGLEAIRKQSVETDIVSRLATRFQLSSAVALRLYSSSKLCRQIESGAYGIQYLDAAYLTDHLVLYEPELFEGLDG